MQQAFIDNVVARLDDKMRRGMLSRSRRQPARLVSAAVLLAMGIFLVGWSFAVMAPGFGIGYKDSTTEQYLRLGGGVLLIAGLVVVAALLCVVRLCQPRRWLILAATALSVGFIYRAWVSTGPTGDFIADVLTLLTGPFIIAYAVERLS